MTRISVSTEKRRVSKIMRYITVNGVEFEAWDLYDTLNALRMGLGDIYLTDPRGIYLTDPQMIQLFKKLKVIGHEGNNLFQLQKVKI